MTNSPHTLPEPAPNQAYCDVAALEGGFVQVIDCFYVAHAHEHDKHPAPSLGFVLTHSTSGKRFVFDLGIRGDIENAAPTVQKRAQMFDAQVPQDVVTSLKKGGLDPEDVTHVIISHAHWDHVGNPDVFTKARFIQGGEARKLYAPGYPENPTSVFPTNLFPAERSDWLDVDASWKPLGPFKHTLDYFGDGSMYIVDAPGHVWGHINLLARTSPDGGWIFLAGDSSHDWRLLRGTAEVPEKNNETDTELTIDTIQRIRDLMTVPQVRVVMAHDDEFYEEFKGSDAFFPGKIPSL